MFPSRVEIIPTEGIVDVISTVLPTSSTISITCLPNHGVGPTMQTAIQLSELGYTVIPHLAAKALANRSQLAGILGDCKVAGISEVFAVGGDAAQPAGPYTTGGELLRDIAEFSGGQLSVGVAGYPEGHPGISSLELVDALLAKQDHATRIVTQMCFSADKIHDYVAMLRREGVHLPVWAGVAGAVPRTRLIALATKIGVGTSLRFLSRKGPLARRILIGERYSPGTLLEGLAARPGIEGIQLYSFNSLDALPGSMDSSAPEPQPSISKGNTRV